MTTTTLDTPRTVAQPRAVERVVAGTATSDGAGVKLTRVLTQPLQRRLDPVPDARRVRHRTTPTTTSAASRTIRTAASRRSPT
jgi:redox-sensitive bicupin YhaK (pirin superfamily)